MATETDPSALARLLDLQAEDSAIRRLEQRRATLPEAERLAELQDSLRELGADLDIARKQREELAREQNRLEGEIGIGDHKVAREEQRLFSGAVANPKELSALQAEVEMLKRKRGELEDALLEVMVQRDHVTATEASLERERSSVAAEAEAMTGTVVALTNEIDGDLRLRSTTRAELAAGLRPDLLALYESLRDAKGGVGVATLEGGTCQGCHTKLPAREVERLKADSGELHRCDHCRRLLVVV